jgi:iron complex outermembrane receptor protein
MRHANLRRLLLASAVALASQQAHAETDGAEAQTIPTATLFDLLASYDLGKLNPQAQGLTLNLDATNLFDKRYIASCYGTIWCWYGAGRNVQASLRYR